MWHWRSRPWTTVLDHRELLVFETMSGAQRLSAISRWAFQERHRAFAGTASHPVQADS
jgi:hypothetical protein